jgi:hypothetical protein
MQKILRGIIIKIALLIIVSKYNFLTFVPYFGYFVAELKKLSMTPPEKKIRRTDIIFLTLAFVLSRLLLPLFNIHFRFNGLFLYWQYLDTDTLHHHLLKGLWYDHAQPPLFNLLLGIVLKCFGSWAPIAFSGLLKLISFINSLLLYNLLIYSLPRPSRIPLFITLVYVLSPALMLFENELFYTTFISMLLLVSAWFILRLQEDARQTASPGNSASVPKHVAGICIPLTLLCLTRSMYHLVWLIALGALLLLSLRKTPAFRLLLAGITLSAVFVSGWYIKNLLIFNQFSTSSWIGMNLARTVFHDVPIKDSSRIESLEPFSDLHYYHSFIADSEVNRYAGVDDRDLMTPKKNDSSSNLNAVAYIQLSRQYMAASKAYVKAHPIHYMANVAQSSLLFFAPATRYPFSEPEALKIKYYDLAYSFNLSYFAKGKEQRRLAVLFSAIPKLLVYLTVAFLLLRMALQQKHLPPLSLFAMSTIAFVFLVSSLVEHYENMRFRYEVEPLFLLLLGQALAALIASRKKQY